MDNSIMDFVFVFGVGVVLLFICAEICKHYDRKRGLTMEKLMRAKSVLDENEANEPRITIKGVPKSLEFTLVGCQDALMNPPYGGVQINFNGDGTIFRVRKVLLTPYGDAIE